MKLQNMAVVFIIIILPVTLILSAYIQSQIDTAQLLLSYDTKLLDAAHDAMRAFELNTTNDDFATIGDSKRRDVEASITTFTNNLATNMGVGGYSKKYIEPYLPAVLFTLYDGYYIYTPTPYVKGEEVKQADGSTKIAVSYTHLRETYKYVNVLEFVDGEYVITNKISDFNIKEMRNNMDENDVEAFDQFLKENNMLETPKRTRKTKTTK